MAIATLKSLHTYLRLLENSSELKRRMPPASNQRTLKEGLSEMARLLAIDPAVFKDPQKVADLIGSQRFTLIWGEPSITAHVARIFDGSRVLFTVLIDPQHFETPTAALSGSHPGPGPRSGPTQSLSAGWAQAKADAIESPERPNADGDKAIENLKPLLLGNLPLTCRLFRVLFEHMLGFASSVGDQPGSGSLVNELIGSKEHSRSFLATVMFVLGEEIDRENLVAFMLEQGLFGIQIFEQMLQNRDYCGAYYTFRRLEKTFMASPAEEEKNLRDRFDRFNARFGGKPYGAKLFESEDLDKIRIDASGAAVDLLEAMSLTPWSMSVNHAVSATSLNSIRFMRILAADFELFGHGKKTREQANQDVADNLLAFARQFSADSRTT